MNQHTTAWAALENPQFRKFWIAGTVMGTGQVIQDVTSGWIMTSLTSSPLAVALLQTAVSLPVLLIALPAGAIADLVDRRKWMMGLLTLQAANLALLTVLAMKQMLTPELLLCLIAVAGCLAAAFTPAWMRTVPDLLSGPQIPWGVTLNSTAVNIARLFGATIAGFVLTNLWPGAGFALSSVCYLLLLVRLNEWHRPIEVSTLPPEPFSSALAGALQYAMHSRDVQRVAVRTLAFSVCASALMALMPSLARQTLKLTAFEFGLVWASFGAGAVIGATLLAPIRARIPLDSLMMFATGVVALGFVAIAAIQSFAVLLAVLLVIGCAWVAMLSSFGVAMGSSSPGWVLARMLALFMLCFQGGAAIGSILWGQLGQMIGLTGALHAAAACLGVTMLLRFAVPMPQSDPKQLAPSHHWPEAETHNTDPGAGPVQISVEYKVPEAATAEFIRAMHQFRSQRLRDGAYNWHLYRCVDTPLVYREQFQLPTWASHMRQHGRVTLADRALQDAVESHHSADHPPEVSHWISSTAIDHQTKESQ